MRLALIDNSTLTAVQRILGDIKLLNRYNIDTDILSLENYIQSILFYDKLIYIDDYKSNFRESRREYFNKMLVYNISKDKYNLLIKKSKDIVESIVPMVNAGEFSDADFKPFFDLLKMSLTFTWDLSSSEYFLTVKLLESVDGVERGKYNELMSMIREELMDKSGSKSDFEPPKPILYGSNGLRISSRELDSRTMDFFMNLNWLAFRSIFYTLVANDICDNDTSVDLFLHSIRDAFHINFIKKVGLINDNTYKNILTKMNQNSRETLNNILENSQPFIREYKIPLFTAFIAKETRDPSYFIKTAYEIRNNDEFISLRQQFIELEKLLLEDRQEYIKKINRLNQDMANELSVISSKYEVSTPQGIAYSKYISLYNLAATAFSMTQIPDMNRNLDLFHKIREFFPKKGFTPVYRSLIENLVQVERLGELHDIITSRINYHENAGFHGFKVEPKIFYGKETEWKIPM